MDECKRLENLHYNIDWDKDLHLSLPVEPLHNYATGQANIRRYYMNNKTEVLPSANWLAAAD
jgi:hypothetical protein